MSKDGGVMAESVLLEAGLIYLFIFIWPILWCLLWGLSLDPRSRSAINLGMLAGAIGMTLGYLRYSHDPTIVFLKNIGWIKLLLIAFLGLGVGLLLLRIKKIKHCLYGEK